MIRRLLTGLVALVFAATGVADAQTYRPGFGFSRPGFQFLGGGGADAGLRPQDVFATSLYTGTGAARTITNGLDLAGKGGLVWTKNRTDGMADHLLIDTVRGGGEGLSSNSTASVSSGWANTFSSTGYATGSIADARRNANGAGYSVWSFRRAAKFFDVVTYTGDSTAARQIAHGLGIKPGMIVVKNRDGSQAWNVYHQALGAGALLLLNTTESTITSNNGWGGVEPTTTTFTVGVNNNTSGTRYVAYIFAHDPDTTNGVIQCGSGNVTLPWSTQWVVYKDAGAASDWRIQDAARGFTPAGSAPSLAPNLSNAEAANGALSVSGSALAFSGLTTPVWCAIRAPV